MKRLVVNNSRLLKVGKVKSKEKKQRYYSFLSTVLIKAFRGRRDDHKWKKRRKLSDLGVGNRTKKELGLFDTT